MTLIVMIMMLLIMMVILMVILVVAVCDGNYTWWWFLCLFRSILVIVQAATNKKKTSDLYASNEVKPFSAGSSDPYVTAGFKHSNLPTTFVIGDGNSYTFGGENYINQPLKENTIYILFVMYIESEVKFLLWYLVQVWYLDFNIYFNIRPIKQFCLNYSSSLLWIYVIVKI